jgi:hypothetical protein
MLVLEDLRIFGLCILFSKQYLLMEKSRLKALKIICHFELNITFYSKTIKTV